MIDVDSGNRERFQLFIYNLMVKEYGHRMLETRMWGPENTP